MMPTVTERSYRFARAAHWRAGARRGLRILDDRLVVSSPVEVRLLSNSGSADGGSVPAVDQRGRILWLRRDSGQLRRWVSADLPPLGQGTLDGAAGARRLIAGESVLWVVANDSLRGYDIGSCQPLTPSPPAPGWRLSDATGDGHDGLWITETDNGGKWRIRHVDCWGRTCGEPRRLGSVSAGQLAVALTADGSQVIVMDPVLSAELTVIDVGRGTARRLGLDANQHAGRTLMAVGPDGAVHLLTIPDEFGRNDRKLFHQEVDPGSGAVEGQQVLDLPRELGQPTSLAGNGTKLVLGGTRGLAELVSVSSSNETRRATFITPALVSPLNARSGWDRADIDAFLPAGTTMEVTWAASSELWLADWATQTLADPSTPGIASLLEERLPWQPAATLYRGDNGPAVTHTALLNKAEETTLWLRIDLRTTAGSKPPQLAGLRVHYPNTSYLDYLPAIYRENRKSEEDLRQVLAPYEVLLDGIDEMLNRIPERMHPASATDGWTDYLLGWLGFPPLGGLDAGLQQKLLARAAELLESRGTRAGLEKLLDVVTEGRCSVADSSEEPAGWFLGQGTTPSAGAGPSRLGIDTVVLAQVPQPARAGVMVLGEAPLTHACADPPAMLGRRGRMLTITLNVGRNRRVLEPVLERLLDAFVPAHCRVRIMWASAPEKGSHRLDVDFRLGADSLLHDDGRLRLGASTRLGRWLLPTRGNQPAVLDHGARLGTGLRLL
jgi:phage tail-like protein